MRFIHLLYVPTVFCNLGCRYCYLDEQTSEANLRQDSERAVETLKIGLEKLLEAGVMPFNVSLHGGEVTTLPPAVLESLFQMIREHYRRHVDVLSARGLKKWNPHIKTNLFNFDRLVDLFDRYQVSVSASIDLPLDLHERFRTTKDGRSTLAKTLANLKLLGQYRHDAKISATLYRQHIADAHAVIRDIWTLHREHGFNMNRFNVMFGFENNNLESGLERVPDDEQAAFYQVMKDAFVGTELEEGFHRHWFDEFKPTYCTNCRNCGERFFLLQSNGDVYSCVRGQGDPNFRYGNLLTDSVATVLGNGRERIIDVHQRMGLDVACQTCEHLHRCQTGCAFVKLRTMSGKSYTCRLQKAIYKDNPASYPPQSPEEQQAELRDYVADIHPARLFDEPLPEKPVIRLPNDLTEDKNALASIIGGDKVLQELYSDSAVVMELAGSRVTLQSPLLAQQRSLYTVLAGDRVVVHVRRSFMEANCPEAIRNTLYLQMLRDTPVVYGDEARTKQEHLFTFQLFANHLSPTSALGPEWLSADLTDLLHAYRRLYVPQVANNLFVTTQYLRDYHYQKQRSNGFYHIQALNLPFQNLEFYWHQPLQGDDHATH